MPEKDNQKHCDINGNWMGMLGKCVPGKISETQLLISNVLNCSTRMEVE